MLRHLPYHSNYQECARIVKFYAVLARRGAPGCFCQKTARRGARLLHQQIMFDRTPRIILLSKVMTPSQLAGGRRLC